MALVLFYFILNILLVTLETTSQLRAAKSKMIPLECNVDMIVTVPNLGLKICEHIWQVSVKEAGLELQI